MLKWAKNEENLALQDVFSKVFEVSTMWTTVMKDFTEEVFIIFVLLNLYYFFKKIFQIIVLLYRESNC